jgi:hypothetical protein
MAAFGAERQLGPIAGLHHLLGGYAALRAFCKVASHHCVSCERDRRPSSSRFQIQFQNNQYRGEQQIRETLKPVFYS